MKLPDYITVKEVQRVCKKLGLSDWTQRQEPRVSPEEAEIILKEVNVGEMEIPPEEFRVGLEVELEHGTRFEDANVTNNHPILTGKIVLAHLKETMDYYQRLEVTETEGDLVKALIDINPEKVARLYRKLLRAKLALSQVEAEQLE